MDNPERCQRPQFSVLNLDVKTTTVPLPWSAGPRVALPFAPGEQEASGASRQLFPAAPLSSCSPSCGSIIAMKLRLTPAVSCASGCGHWSHLAVLGAPCMDPTVGRPRSMSWALMAPQCSSTLRYHCDRTEITAGAQHCDDGALSSLSLAMWATCWTSPSITWAGWGPLRAAWRWCSPSCSPGCAGLRGPGGSKEPLPLRPRGAAVMGHRQLGSLRPVNFQWTAVLQRLYLLLVGVRDFATLGSRVILPVFCSKFNCCTPFLP